MRSLKFFLFALVILCAGILAVFNGCDEEKSPTSSGNHGGVGDTIPPVWKLEISHDTGVLGGHYHDVDITLPTCSLAIGGFDLLITFDPAVLVFVQAVQGQYFVDCGWEYFTYRYNYDDSCGPDCPGGLVRLVGVAETNNGANHPDLQCLTDAAGEVLATITFFVNGDRQFECTKNQIRFYWLDCGDNSIATYGGDSLAINRRIYDTAAARIEDYQAEFPCITGAPDSTCLQFDSGSTFRGIDFVNGGIDIACEDSISMRGDLDQNGMANEISDAVLYTDYFKEGLSVFEPHVEASIAASDVNGDGETLTLADLEYLIRIIQGEALPLPLQIPDTTANLAYQSGYIRIDSPIDVGAVFLTFDLNGVPINPVLLVPDMSVMDTTVNDELRVLIYDIGPGYMPSGETDILMVPPTAILTGADAAGYEGNSIRLTINSKR